MLSEAFGMNDRVEEIDDECDDHRQQYVQAHVLFLACRLPMRPAQDVESGAITPCEKNTSPTNKPKNPIKRRSMNTMISMLRILVRRLIVLSTYGAVARKV